MTDFSWLGASYQAPIAQLEHVTDLWTLRGVTGKDLTCSVWKVATGLELRAGYSVDHLVASELFRGPNADERLAEKADAWRVALVAKGFREIAK